MSNNKSNFNNHIQKEVSEREKELKNKFMKFLFEIYGVKENNHNDKRKCNTNERHV